MPLKDFCSREVACISPQASIREAAKLMRDRHVGDLVVVENPDHPRKPLGIITDRDLAIRVLTDTQSPDAFKIEDVMNRDLLVVRTDDGLFHATEALERAGVRRLPIVDQDGNLKGLISADDLYEILAEELGNLSRISTRQGSREGPGFKKGTNNHSQESVSHA